MDPMDRKSSSIHLTSWPAVMCATLGLNYLRVHYPDNLPALRKAANVHILNAQDMRNCPLAIVTGKHFLDSPELTKFSEKELVDSGFIAGASGIFSPTDTYRILTNAWKMKIEKAWSRKIDKLADRLQNNEPLS